MLPLLLGLVAFSAVASLQLTRLVSFDREIELAIEEAFRALAQELEA